jgi:hypothetical protein
MKTASVVAVLITAAFTCMTDAQSPAPRINGKPDLSGLWQSERTPMSEYAKALPPQMLVVQPDFNDVTKHFVNVFWDMNPADWPVRPEAAAISDERQKSGRDFQTAYCLPGSLPAALVTMNFKMIQTPKEVVVISGNGDPARQIPIGRSLPKDPLPSWMGTSVGRWDGDTFVVETTGFNERAWLDAFGHPRSEHMRITERYRRRDATHMDLDVSFDDAKYYTRPFGFKTTLTRLSDDHVFEYVCTENEKDAAHTK